MTEINPTGSDLIFDLWWKCMTTAREAGEVPAGAVEQLILRSREILTERGCAKRDADLVLFNIYTAIHWDGNQPTDRIFETLLEFELAEFFKERGLPG